jgi:methionyl-tRNA synthetase
LGISNDFYVRTTSAAHMARCQAFWTKALDKGDVYLGTYEGW